jgi:hypothetical protein
MERALHGHVFTVIHLFIVLYYSQITKQIGMYSQSSINLLYFTIHKLLSKLAQVVMLWTCVCKMPNSNLDYSDMFLVTFLSPSIQMPG